MKRFLLACTVLLASALPSWASPVVVFGNLITGPNPSSTNPFTAGQTLDPNLLLTGSGIGRGAGFTANAGNDRYNVSSLNTNALDPTGYFTFLLATSSGYQLGLNSFQYTSSRSNISISGFAFRSSLDSFANDIGTPIFSGATIDLTAPSFQGLTTPTEFRFYAWGAGASGNTFSIDNFSFVGEISPVPEPTSIVFGGILSGAGWIAFRRRRKTKQSLQRN